MMRRQAHTRSRRGMLCGFAAALGLAVISIMAAAQQPRQQARKGVSSLRTPDTTAIRPTVPGVNRHIENRVFLERARELRALQGVNYQIVVGDVEFRKGDMFMYCDSAHFYDNPGQVDAFGNVRMEQGDTLFVYADMLTYSDSTQLAVLYADPGKKVRLINRDVTLTTDIFNYDLGIELGFYEVGGTLTDKDNRLVSHYGEYSPASKDALFRTNVHLNSLSDNDTLDIYTQEMLYNTLTHIAILDTTSTIIAKDGTIYTTQGVYNTETSQADLYSRSLVVASNGNTLTGDTLYYDKNIGFGEAFGNIELTDTTNKVILTGDYGYYYENSDSAMVTGRALAREYSSPDTLYLHADTIRTYLTIRSISTGSEDDDYYDDAPRPQTPVAAPAPAAPVPALEVPVDSLPSDSVMAELPTPVDSVAAPPVAPVDSVAADTPEIDSLAIDVDSLGAHPIPADSLAVPEVEVPLPADSISASEEAPEAPPRNLVEAADAPLAMEEAPAPPQVLMDTTHLLIAAPHVRFYRTDLQGLCDSMAVVQSDSILYMHYHPVVWNETKQIFGNVIQVHLNDSTADWARLPEFGFMAEWIDEEFYNQMAGTEMFATFEGGTIKHLDVKGNVQVVMLPMENDSTYNKIANVESSFLSADFVNQNIDRLKMWPESPGTMTPLYLAKKNLFYLPQFRWFEPLKPTSPEDVFNVSREMLDLMQEPPFGSRKASR